MPKRTVLTAHIFIIFAVLLSIAEKDEELRQLAEQLKHVIAERDMPLSARVERSYIRVLDILSKHVKRARESSSAAVRRSRDIAGTCGTIAVDFATGVKNDMVGMARGRIAGNRKKISTILRRARECSEHDDAEQHAREHADSEPPAQFSWWSGLPQALTISLIMWASRNQMVQRADAPFASHSSDQQQEIGGNIQVLKLNVLMP